MAAGDNSVVVSSDAPDVSVSIAPDPTPEPVGRVESTDEAAVEAAAQRARDAATGRFTKADGAPESVMQEPAGEQAQDAGGEQPQPRKGSPEYRIGQAIKRQREAERRAEALQAQYDERMQAYERQLAEFQQGYANRPPEKPQAAPRDPDEPREADFERYEDYIDARASYRAEKKAREYVEATLPQQFEAWREAERRREADERAIRAEQAALAEHAKHVELGLRAHADYAEVMEDTDVEVSAVMRDAIVHSEMGHELAYFFAMNPPEADRIRSLPPGRAIYEMGKLESRLAAALPTGSAPSVPVSKAPPPVKPVTGGTHVPSQSIEDLSPSEYIRAMNKRDLERRGLR